MRMMVIMLEINIDDDDANNQAAPQQKQHTTNKLYETKHIKHSNTQNKPQDNDS